MFTPADSQWMAHALQLAERGLNPLPVFVSSLRDAAAQAVLKELLASAEVISPYSYPFPCGGSVWFYHGLISKRVKPRVDIFLNRN